LRVENHNVIPCSMRREVNMIERTMTTESGNRVTYMGMETLDGKVRKTVESAHGRRISWSQAYDSFTSAAEHTAYASANKVPLFQTARPVPLDRHLRIERMAAALADGIPKDDLVAMIDDDVLRRTRVDIRGKFFQNGETFGVRVPVSGYFSPELTLFVCKLMLKGANIVPITEHGEEPVPYGVTVVAPFTDQALNALQITEGIAHLGRQFLTPAQRNRYNEMRNAAIAQRNGAPDSGTLPAVPPELDPINAYGSFLQNPVSLRGLVRDSYPRPKQGEEVRSDFATRLQLDLGALDKFAGMAWVGGGGAIGDFGNNTRDWMLLEAFIKGGKPVAGICYGSIVLAQVKDSLTGVYLLQGHFATGHGEADNYTENTATMNPDGTYNPSVSGAAPINLSDMLRQAIGPEEGGYVTELGQAPMAVMSGGAIFTGNTVEDGDSVADLLLAHHLGGLNGDYFIAGDGLGRVLTRDDPAVERIARW
jgi:putative intracellular protease/amidase